KTSGRADATMVSIHGLEQLAAPTGGCLHLVHVRLERVGAGSLGVGTIFDELLELGCNKRLLMNALAALSCDDPYADEWNRLTFSLEGLSCYQVDERFPRIVSSSFHSGVLPSGLSSIEYKVDLVCAHKLMLP